MWLLDTNSLALTAFFDDNTPHYAILSHTWGPEEVSFQDIQAPHETITNRAGYHKIKGFCSKALEAGFQYGWIDTCCIDKTNNAELSEAINSMYRWYANAVTCYAYLADVPHPEKFSTSRWFERGWTLQELIAPPEVLFFDISWSEIGSRASLALEIGEGTRIPTALLTMKSSLKDHCVAEIMSWAAGRRTTRAEDRAYSLLGLFGVYMPMLYGEGENAFMRLQLEIIKSTTDHSIFASDTSKFWVPEERGILARSIDAFHASGRVRSLPAIEETSFEMTNLGLRITLPSYLQSVDPNGCRNLVAYLNCKFDYSSEPLSIHLKEASSVDGKPLGRFRPCGISDRVCTDHDRERIKPTLIYIMQPTDRYYRGLPQTEMSLLCSLDYSALNRAGYSLERFVGPYEELLLREKVNSKILFELESWNLNEQIMIVPQIWVIFKHASRSKRFWVILGLRDDQVLCRIEENRGNIDPPESFIDNQIHEWYYKGESLSSFDYSIEKHFEAGEIVRLTSQRALIVNRVGRMMKITSEESYLD